MNLSIFMFSNIHCSIRQKLATLTTRVQQRLLYGCLKVRVEFRIYKCGGHRITLMLFYWEFKGTMLGVGYAHVMMVVGMWTNYMEDVWKMTVHDNANVSNQDSQLYVGNVVTIVVYSITPFYCQHGGNPCITNSLVQGNPSYEIDAKFQRISKLYLSQCPHKQSWLRTTSLSYARLPN